MKLHSDLQNVIKMTTMDFEQKKKMICDKFFGFLAEKKVWLKMMKIVEKKKS